ncbi:MAG: hypothetical protein ACK5KM_10250 [Hyphomicrobiaceae bacterium]
MTQSNEPAGAGQSPKLSGLCMLGSLAAALAWAVITAVHGYNTWPHIPMDISANDPATQAAFQSVITRHAVVHAVVGIVPLVLVFLLRSYICRRRS